MNLACQSLEPALLTPTLNFLPGHRGLCWKPRYLSYQVFFKLHCIYFYFSHNLCNHPLIELQLTVCVWEVADNISAVCALTHACQLFWHNIYLPHKSSTAHFYKKEKKHNFQMTVHLIFLRKTWEPEVSLTSGSQSPNKWDSGQEALTAWKCETAVFGPLPKILPSLKSRPPPSQNVLNYSLYLHQHR